MSRRGDEGWPPHDETRGLRIWCFELAAAVLFLVASGLCILLAASLIMYGSVILGLPGSAAVMLTAATPFIVPMLLVALLSRPVSGRGRPVRHRSSWLVRLDPDQPPDTEIVAAAQIALQHFGGDRGMAVSWARSEAVRFLGVGDLRRNLIAVRLQRAILALQSWQRIDG